MHNAFGWGVKKKKEMLCNDVEEFFLHKFSFLPRTFIESTAQDAGVRLEKKGKATQEKSSIYFLDLWQEKRKVSFSLSHGEVYFSFFSSEWSPSISCCPKMWFFSIGRFIRNDTCHVMHTVFRFLLSGKNGNFCFILPDPQNNRLWWFSTFHLSESEKFENNQNLPHHWKKVLFIISLHHASSSVYALPVAMGSNRIRRVWNRKKQKV